VHTPNSRLGYCRGARYVRELICSARCTGICTAHSSTTKSMRLRQCRSYVCPATEILLRPGAPVYDCARTRIRTSSRVRPMCIRGDDSTGSPLAKQPPQRPKYKRVEEMLSEGGHASSALPRCGWTADPPTIGRYFRLSYQMRADAWQRISGHRHRAHSTVARSSAPYIATCRSQRRLPTTLAAD